MNDFALSCKQLTVGYDGTPLLKDLNFSLPRGAILCLIGPNGAGKTTIIKTLISQIKPIEGTVYLSGSKLSELKSQERARELSIVLTRPVQTELMNCYEVVATARHPYTGRFGVLNLEDEAAVAAALQEVGVSHLAKRDFRLCSDGEKQRVMLARALCQDASVMILDEPTSHLDLRHKLDFLGIVQKLARRGITIVMSLHELELAVRIADLIACVKGDSLTRLGSPAEIFADGYAASLYDLPRPEAFDANSFPELPRSSGEPTHFVLAGAGGASHLMRALQRADVAFNCGILADNEADFAVATALATEVIWTRPRQVPNAREVARAKSLLSQAENVLFSTAEEELCNLGEAWQELISEAKRLNKPIQMAEEYLHYGI
ncbi:MAG: ABC transporter ATP-binding protein [Eubacteriales bacterium]|nr:ABC transporter ATP-binding protein [Eubacteriales bacterium]